jgi:hypothetical protein
MRVCRTHITSARLTREWLADWIQRQHFWPWLLAATTFGNASDTARQGKRRLTGSWILAFLLYVPLGR